MDSWAMVALAPRTGRTTRRSAPRRPLPVTPSASCTSTAEQSTSPSNSATTELLEAVLRRRRDMVATRSYLTGGLGSRHRDEAFGDPFELPPDRAYAETCAAIASVMLSWRLLLATGDPAHADVLERTILNGVLAGVGLDGVSFSYENPSSGGRIAWPRRTGQRSARRGSRVRAARRTSCARSPRGRPISRRRTMPA